MNWYPKRRTKYNSVSCTCQGGHNHDSRAEAGYCNQLALLVKMKQIRSYERQVRYELAIGKKHITTHIVDFVVTDNDGKIHVEEYKGFATDVWAIKKRLFEALYPEIPYIVIKG